MQRCTLQQRIKMVNIHYKNCENFAVTVRKTKSFWSSREAPSRAEIVKPANQFELWGPVSDMKNQNRVPHSTSTLLCIMYY